MNHKPLLILGASSFAVETLEIVDAAGGFDVVGFINSLERPAPGTTHAGLPVFGVDELPLRPGECWLVAGIVSTRRRAAVEMLAARGYRLASAVHPSAVISRSATLGEGCVVNAGVVISSKARLESNVIVNRGALIGHDVVIHSFCTLGPGANVAGAVEIGDGTYIGVGAVIRDHLTIGAGAVVGAGAVIVKPVPDHVLVAGVRASVRKTSVDGL